MLARRQAGDTLIEVLLAVAIFSAVTIGTMVIMSQGISQAQSSLETTLVRNQVDTQAELLRHLNNAKLTSIGRNDNEYSSQWDLAIQGANGAAASKYDAITTIDECRPDAPELANAFYIHPETGKVIYNNFEATQTFAQIQVRKLPAGAPADEVNSVSNMLWIEAVQGKRDAMTLTNHYDFHIRACWESAGGGGLMKIGTIVRLYAPIQ